MISGEKSCVACNIYVDMRSGGPSSLFLRMAISPLPLEDFSAPPEKENARSRVALTQTTVLFLVMTVRVKVHYGKRRSGVCNSKGLKNSLANERKIVHRKSCLVLFAPSSCHYLMLGCLLCLISYLCGLKLWRSATALRTLTSARTAFINRCRVEQEIQIVSGDLSQSETEKYFECIIYWNK